MGGGLIIIPIAGFLWFGQLPLLQAQHATGWILSVIVMIVPLSAIVVKRLNDADRSRWLVVLPCMLELAQVGITFAIYNVSLDETRWRVASAANIGLLAAWLGVLFLIERLPGTPGPNRFGPPPTPI